MEGISFDFVAMGKIKTGGDHHCCPALCNGQPNRKCVYDKKKKKRPIIGAMHLLPVVFDPADSSHDSVPIFVSLFPLPVL